MSDFDPSKYFMKVGSADYLPVAWRLVWLHHDADHRGVRVDLQTDIIEHDHTGQLAVFRAVASLISADGVVIRRSTGHGSETANHFRDYLEKAETKAVGRALAMLGYGTQFAGDDLNEGRIVDAPHRISSDAQQVPQTPPGVSAGRESSIDTLIDHELNMAGPSSFERARTASSDVRTPQQFSYMEDLAVKAGLSQHELGIRLDQMFPGKTTSTLTRAEASKFIDSLKVLVASMAK